MADVNIHPNQGLLQGISSEFTSMTRITPAGESFYTSIGLSLLSQISRLKGILRGNQISEKLKNLINEVTQIVPNSNPYSNLAPYLIEMLKNGLEIDIDSYDSWLFQCGRFISAAFRVVISRIISKSPQSQDSSNMLNPHHVIQNEIFILNQISRHLDIVIEYYSVNAPVQTINDSICPVEKPVISIIMFTTQEGKEFAVLRHSLCEIFSSTKDPSVLRNPHFLIAPLVPKQSSAPFIPSGVPFINQNYSLPPNTFNLNLPIPPGPGLESERNIRKKENLTDLLTCFLDILVKSQWKFSVSEANELKPALNQIEKNQKLKEKVKTIKQINKFGKCEHSFKNFFALECNNLHCVECIRSEIKLKSLQSHQIFCDCKKKLSEEEQNYYFSKEILSTLKTINEPHPISGQKSFLPDPINVPQKIQPELDQNDFKSDAILLSPRVGNDQFLPPPVGSGPPTWTNKPPDIGGSNGLKSGPGFGGPPSEPFKTPPPPPFKPPIGGLDIPGMVNPNTTIQRPKFCTSCKLVIKPPDLVEVNGMSYHKNHAPQ